MLGFSTVGLALWMYYWLMFRLFQECLTWKKIAYYNMLYTSVRSETRQSFVPTSQNIVQCWFIINMIIPNKCVSGLTSWMTLEIHFFNSLEALYVFVKFLLLSWRSNVYVIYTCRVQLSLYGDNLLSWRTWLDLSINFHSGNYKLWTFITLIYLNLGLISDIISCTEILH